MLDTENIPDRNDINWGYLASEAHSHVNRTLCDRNYCDFIAWI